ncbi:unnamed protein product, partial [Trichobilharzia regenti]
NYRPSLTAAFAQYSRSDGQREKISNRDLWERTNPAGTDCTTNKQEVMEMDCVLNFVVLFVCLFVFCLGSKEDQENTESLVGNAQNLMQTVIETLHVAEGASIKMRVHSGHKFVW